MTYTLQTVGFSYETLKRTHEDLVRKFHASVLTSAQTRRETSLLQALASWALRTTPTGWAVIRGGKVVFTNRAFDAFDRGSVIGPGWKRFIGYGEGANQDDGPGRTLQEISLEEASLLLANAEACRRQERFSRGDKIVEVAVERPLSGHDQKWAALVQVRDIADLVKAESRLASLQAQVLEAERAAVAAELAAGVAHDLGNLVGALRSRVVGLPDDPAYRLVTTAMQTILDAQAALVNRLQSVVHPRSAALATLDLFKEVVQPAVQMVETSLRVPDETGQGRISIDLDVSLFEEIHIIAPRDEVINMVINLLLNARDAMPDGGTVTIGAHRLFGGVELRIEDNGFGIPPGNLQRIFEPLFSTKGSKGMGMGLATAAALMRRLGGSISARNRARGGACFDLIFVDNVVTPEST
jgi:signal transduction histidine kinase